MTVAHPRRRPLSVTMVGNLFYIAVYVTVFQLLRRADATAFFAP